MWTLPDAITPAMPSRRRTYLDALRAVIERCRNELLVVSPFLDPGGIGSVFTPLVTALARGVRVTFVSHDVLTIGSLNGRALEELRREASRVGGQLTVYSAAAGSGPDRRLHPLLHAKLVVSDGENVLLGSANLTSYALCECWSRSAAPAGLEV